MDKELNLIENANPSDSLAHGFVVVVDSDGKILVKQHNMITADGRKYLRNLLANAMISSKIKTDMAKIDNIYVGSGTDITVPGSVFDESTLLCKKALTQDNIIVETGDTDKGCIKITCEIKADEDLNNNINPITEFGLLRGTKLFSRLVHEPVYLNANITSFTINYYIYF